MTEEPDEDDERSIWLPPEELKRLQRERNREMRAMLRSVEQDGFAVWNGDGRPVSPETVVQVRYSDGITETNKAGTWLYSWSAEARKQQVGIVAYRVCVPTVIR
jgi:hypothetical protein